MNCARTRTQTVSSLPLSKDIHDRLYKVILALRHVLLVVIDSLFRMLVGVSWNRVYSYTCTHAHAVLFLTVVRF